MAVAISCIATFRKGLKTNKRSKPMINWIFNDQNNTCESISVRAVKRIILAFTYNASKKQKQCSNDQDPSYPGMNPEKEWMHLSGGRCGEW